MTYLARWLIDAPPAANGLTCTDSVGGGSGAHDGTYYDTSIYQILEPGGVAGRHLYHSGITYPIRVQSFSNLADLRILGELTITAWVACSVVSNGAPILCVGGPSASEVEADNELFLFYLGASNRMTLKWEQGAGVDVLAQTATNTLKKSGLWRHVAVVRRLFSGGPNHEVEFFVDGASVALLNNASAGYAPPTGGGNAVAVIGDYITAGNYGVSHISTVRLYSHDATADIPTIYSTEKALIEPAVREFPLTRGKMAWEYPQVTGRHFTSLEVNRTTNLAGQLQARYWGVDSRREGSGFQR